MRQQPSLFDDQRMTLEYSIEMTAQSLNAYADQYKHWAIAYSGGKDSSATVSIIHHLIRTGQVRRPESLTALYADTRMEIPSLAYAASRMMDYLREDGIDARVVLPPIDKRFFVYMFGRGVPPPSNTFRWCTPSLKITPMMDALKALREKVGEKILMLTGVRVGESAKRDQRIALSCGKNGAECGQGWFQETTPESVADTLAPILHWRVCHVWDWLMLFAPGHGYPTEIVADAYGGEEAQEINARTGCVGCNLASRDLALETLLRNPKWQYLRPLMELRPLYAELKKPQNRLRKDGTERRKDGVMVSNPMRMGPLTMEARRWGLSQVIDVQERINEVAHDKRLPHMSLVSREEEYRIYELIIEKTWPDGWSGDEPVADVWQDEVIADGVVQPLLGGIA